ncbi:hypothetical protein GYA49_02830 [Candidatus Beckwithbacteria bacterium]|nr:hypothetical protein [Candidatus Beckwithbacteria bacterium]
MLKLKTFSFQSKITLIFFIGLLCTRLLYSSLYTSFSQDVARDVLLTENRIASHEYIVAYGPKASVWNFYVPPFYYQLHLIVSLLGGNYPLAMKWFTTVITTATPIFLLLILKKFVKFEYAFLAAVFFAFSPTVLSNSVNTWSPTLVPLLSTIALWAWVLFIKDKKPWAIVGALLATTLAIHLHYQAVMLLPFSLILFAWTVYKRPSFLKYWLVGIVLSCLTFTPYALAEINNNFHNTQEIIKFFTLEHSHYYDQISKPAYVFTFLPGFVERVLIGLHHNYWLGRLVLYLGLLVLGWVSLKNKRQERWLLLYFLLIFIMLRIYKGDKLDYYLSTLYILPYVLLAFLYQAFKLVAVFLSLGLVFLSASFLLKQIPYNDFLSLKEELRPITDTQTHQAKFLIHDSNDINRFAYGIKHFDQVAYNANSHQLIELCQNIEWCKWDEISRCIYSRAYTYASLLKSQNTYHYIFPKGGLEDIDSKLIITSFDKPIGIIADYRLYPRLDGYELDTVLPEAYQW